ncbi:hypothetical protein ABPG72_013631 [Tetrahymena utriculariae]
MSSQKEFEFNSLTSDQQSQEKQRAAQKQQQNSSLKVDAIVMKQKNIQDSAIYGDEIDETDCRNQQNKDQILSLDENAIIQTEKNSSPQNIETQFIKNNIFSYKASQTINLEDNYFEEDQEDKEEEKLIKHSLDIKNLKSYNMIFRKRPFFEFFIYHFIYFIFLGPFTSLITRLGGKYLSRNLQFIGRSRSVYLQLVNYLMSIITNLFYFNFTNPAINQTVYLSTLIVVVVFRCFQISTKYATFDPLKIKIYKEVQIKVADLSYDLFLQDWTQQTDKIIYEQIYYTQRFFDTDPNLFFIQFMVEPSKKTADQIKNSKIKMEEQFNLRKTHKKPDPIGVQTSSIFYDGYTILHFLISLYQKQNSSKRKALKNIITVMSVIRGLLPLFCALIISFSSSVLGMYWSEILQILYFPYQFRCYILLFFFRQALLTILQELSFMLIPRKIGTTNTSKVLPTINIVKKESLKGWSTLRKSIMAYGKSYSIRVEILIAVMALYSFACLLLIVLAYFKVIKINIVIIVEIGFDTFFMIAIVSFVLYWGANLNQTFTDQITNLYNNKIYVQDLLLVQDSYMNKGKISNNFLYNKGLQIAKQNLEENQSIKEYLQDLLDYYQQIMDEDLKDQIRGIKIGNHFQLENILSNSDMMSVSKDLYIVRQLFETNLHHQVIYSHQELTDDHIQYFAYQILCALFYLHSQNICHNYLRPENILVHKNCDLKISCFKQACQTNSIENKLAQYRQYCYLYSWYSSPEQFLNAYYKTSDKNDVWCVGLIMAELLGRSPLFPQTGKFNKLSKIISKIGTPSLEQTSFLDNQTFQYLKSLPKKNKQSWQILYPDANPLLLDLFDKMIVFNSQKRFTVKQC